MNNSNVTNELIKSGVLLYVVRVVDGRKFEILELTDKAEAVIADDEGFRKVVKFCFPDCSCSSPKPWTLSVGSVEAIHKAMDARNFKIDRELLSPWLSDMLDGGNLELPVPMEIGTYVKLKDSRLECDGQPDMAQLVYVTNVYYDHTYNQHMFAGYSTFSGEIIRVEGECWRFKMCPVDL